MCLQRSLGNGLQLFWLYSLWRCRSWVVVEDSCDGVIRLLTSLWDWFVSYAVCARKERAVLRLPVSFGWLRRGSFEATALRLHCLDPLMSSRRSLA